MEAIIFTGLQGSGKSSFYKDRWRNEDAAGNALNSWCYWTLRKDGQSEEQATKRLLGLSVSEKNELLFQYDINFNDLPTWQKRGIGLYWEQYDKPAVNPVTGEQVVARRRRIRTDYDLPMKDAVCFQCHEHTQADPRALDRPVRRLQRPD
jgi:tRNA(His) 5'-end guanylyltransferase